MPRLLPSALFAALLASLYALYTPSTLSSLPVLTRLKHCMSTTPSLDQVGVSPLASHAAHGSGDAAGHSVLMDQVVMFGDSITQGSWVAGGTGAELAHKWQRKLDVVNRGLSAEWGIPILKQWLPRSTERLPHIRLLFVWFGANDATLPPSPQSITLERFKENLNTIHTLLSSPSSPYSSPSTQLVYITPPPVDAEARNAELASRDPPRAPDRDRERTRLFAEAVKDVARERGVPSVDVWSAVTREAEERDGGKLGRYLGDGLHLTAEGYRVVTAEVVKMIERDLPHLHWDKLDQTFPHWTAHIPAEKRF
ncbi:hypothetical protein JCM6882_007652 [Rhodosporidiobolus microsporus]